jgi:hypothetical protein
MNPNRAYPFSDLTSEQVRELVEAARQERAEAIRRFFSRLFRRRRKGTFWPERKREAQAWPPKGIPALYFDRVG